MIWNVPDYKMDILPTKGICDRFGGIELKAYFGGSDPVLWIVCGGRKYVVPVKYSAFSGAYVVAANGERIYLYEFEKVV